jgi:chemotaxis methyl-accepting protein methylase
MAWPDPTPPLSNGQLVRWLRLVEERTGIDLSQHHSILQVGISRHLRACGDGDADALFARVTAPAGVQEWQQLLAQITIKETSFLRQPAAFDLVRRFLRARAARCAKSGAPREALELWSVGCATGEEAWGLAMVADQVASANGLYFGVLGSDICARALSVAREGVYPARRLQSLPAAWRQRYFEALPGDDGRMRVVDSLRERVGWVRSNLLELQRLPPLAMDVIYCQNVLVYFRRWRVKQIADALAARLKPGGLLVLGPGEAAQWQHPALARIVCDGVSAWRRRDPAVSEVSAAKIGGAPALLSKAPAAAKTAPAARNEEAGRSDG